MRLQVIGFLLEESEEEKVRFEVLTSKMVSREEFFRWYFSRASDCKISIPDEKMDFRVTKIE